MGNAIIHWLLSYARRIIRLVRETIMKNYEWKHLDVTQLEDVWKTKYFNVFTDLPRAIEEIVKENNKELQSLVKEQSELIDKLYKTIGELQYKEDKDY
jgi:hypothetical protein